MKVLIRSFLLTSLILAAVMGAFWYTSSAQATGRLELLQEQGLIADAHCGLVIQDLDSHELLICHNSDKNFIPASLAKLFTATAALFTLGEDFQFNTQVIADRKPDSKGVIRGVVTLKGNGDPGLTRDSFKILAEKVKEKGVTAIEGNINVSGFPYDDTTLIPHTEWEDLTWHFAPEVHALSIDDNLLTLHISPAKNPGSPAVIEVDEAAPYSTLINLTTTVTDPAFAHDDPLLIERGLTDNRIVVSGSISRGQQPATKKIAIHNPAAYARKTFIKSLQNTGIKFSESSQKCGRKRRCELATLKSPKLEEMIQSMNKSCLNLAAELLIQSSSYQATPDPSPRDIQTGKPAFTLVSNILNLEAPSYLLEGGAGLSRHNSVKPTHVVKLLQAMHDSEFRTLFRTSLPIAGVDGTLAERFKGTLAENNIAAKTGTMRGVSNLAGYATTQSGRNICFALFVNHQSVDYESFQDQADAFLVSLLEKL